MKILDAAGGAIFLAAAGVAFPAFAGVSNPHNLGSCVACHREAPQFGIDTRRTITFTTSADDPGLCTPCHPAAQQLHPVGVDAGSGPAGAQRSTYLPAGATGALAGKVVCTTCHFIHAADGRYALLRGFPGTPDPRHYASWEEFCSDCHGNNLAGRSPHGGGERSCALCHQSRPRPGVAREVVGRDRGLCLNCHRKIREAHYREVDPFGSRRECRDCHDQHLASAERPSLLNDAYLAALATSLTVRPHYRKGLCLTCHTNVDDYELREQDVNVLCDRCHASGQIRANIHPLRTVPPSITIPKGWPLAAGALTCLTCHEQGHEDQTPTPYLLRGGPYSSSREVCRHCHSGADLLASTLHRDINEGKRCEFCHKTRPVPGKDKGDTVVFLADPDLLCMRCHEVGGDENSEHHARFSGSVAAKIVVPEFLPLYKGRMICGTCHNPHQLESAGYRLRSGLAATNLCTGCHTN